MAEFSDDMLVEFALGLRDDRDIQEAVKTSPELRARLRDLECELRGLDEGLEELLAGAPSQSALPSSGWQILLAIDDSPGAKRAAATAGVLGQGWPTQRSRSWTSARWPRAGWTRLCERAAMRLWRWWATW